MNKLNRLLRDRCGATAIEYGLIAALVAVAIMTSVKGVGTSLNQSYSKTSSVIAAANA